MVVCVARDHRKLEAYQFADDLVLRIYSHTRDFPKQEKFGLVSQMRRSAVSAVANIVEGSAREGLAEYRHFLNMAFGSLRELGYYVDLSTRLSYLSPTQGRQLYERYERTAKILSGLIRSLRP